jgi:hypothetical protein
MPFFLLKKQTIFLNVFCSTQKTKKLVLPAQKTTWGEPVNNFKKEIG